ncbi:zf-C3HC4_3 domain-containing protein [Cephalotus follicularis]|uniref:Zf-C3HC4_3 domain-containing protein n=1 Tax=Cephalotus follicularis TaxID=3775 RepID=A0A1Q3BS17_CEPFO|nr:zf-C3HC4_3 domain-containing protein [Cephalotus follicularis]
MEGHRSESLLEQMSALEERRNSLAGLTLDAVLGGEKPPPPPPPPAAAHLSSRTLLDIIRDEEPHKGQRDKKSWKTFRDRLRLKRAGAAWTSSIHIPASDILILNNHHRSPHSARTSHVRFISDPTQSMTRHEDSDETDINPVSDPPGQTSRPMITRRMSSRMGSTQAVSAQDDELADDTPMPVDAPPAQSFRPQISRHNSTRYPNQESAQVDEVAVPAREGSRRLAVVLAEERALSAREAVAAQEAAEAATAAAEAENDEGDTDDVGTPEVAPQETVRMSLMDLLEETDRQMGLVGSRYMMGDEEEVYEEEYEEEEVEEQSAAGGGGGGGVEQTCCVCMVRHKGAAFIPCGHTFCRLCSRELWVQRGNCPLCNGFILEILDIF